MKGIRSHFLLQTNDYSAYLMSNWASDTPDQQHHTSMCIFSKYAGAADGSPTSFSLFVGREQDIRLSRAG